MYFHVINFIVNIFRFIVGITEGRPSCHALGKSESLILTWQDVCLKAQVSYCYEVASKCSQNHFISEKFKTVQSFKLHFLQNSPLAQLYTSASNCKGAGNIPGSFFSLSITFLMMSVPSQKHHPFNAAFSQENR